VAVATTVPPARKRAAERHGTLTLLWVRGDESRFAERVRDCLM
jgi:hypothetical protein